MSDKRNDVYRVSPLTQVIRWYAGLPLALVAANSLIAALVLSATQAAGWNDWGHYGLLLTVVPIVAWAIVQWLVNGR